MADVTPQNDTQLTPGGRPRPLTGRSLATTSVVVKQADAALRRYPDVAVPAREELAEDEMRLICIGSGNPPIRRGQDLTVINVTPEQIVVREAQTDPLHWTPPGPDKEAGPLDPKSPGVTPAFVTDTILPPEE